MQNDTRAWFATRLQAAAVKVANSGTRIPDGYVLVEEDGLADLIRGRVDEEENDQPLDPDEMRAQSNALAMSYNEMMEPVVTHAGSIRRMLIEQGFSEEGAEQLSGNLFIMAAGQIAGDDPDFD